MGLEYSDNGTTFVSAANWLWKVSNEKLKHYFAENKIVWQFNRSLAPWWNEQLERMVCLVKNALHKTVENENEHEEVLLDDDRPLSYVEDPIPAILTPNSQMFHQSNTAPELHCEESYLRKEREIPTEMQNRYVNAMVYL